MRRRYPEATFSDDERALLLAGLFELHITRAEDQAMGGAIHELVGKLGGDCDAMFFSAVDDGEPHAELPLPEYSADETADN
jgi:hypothetical protein